MGECFFWNRLTRTNSIKRLCVCVLENVYNNVVFCKRHRILRKFCMKQYFWDIKSHGAIFEISPTSKSRGLSPPSPPPALTLLYRAPWLLTVHFLSIANTNITLNKPSHSNVGRVRRSHTTMKQSPVVPLVTMGHPKFTPIIAPFPSMITTLI